MADVFARSGEAPPSQPALPSLVRDAARIIKPAPAWAARYVGIPFLEYGRDAAGADCWGLARLVALEQFGFEIPLYSEKSWERGTDAARLAEFIRAERAAQGTWSEIPAGTEEAGDFILMRGGPRMADDVHFGIIVCIGWVLHTEEGIGAGLGRYRDMPIKNRVVSFHRHAARQR